MKEVQSNFHRTMSELQDLKGAGINRPSLEPEMREKLFQFRDKLVISKALAQDVFEFQEDDSYYNNELITMVYRFMNGETIDPLGEMRMIEELLSGDDGDE